MTLTARIIILNYNGEKILPECLPSVVEATRLAKTPARITVLDNLSQDDSENYVRTHFPELEFVKAAQNLVLCSYNDFLKKVAEPVAVLLNNDIRVDRDFLDPLVAHFEKNPKLFLVAPRVHSFDGKMIEAVDTRFRMRLGMPSITARYPGYEAHAMIPSSTFASGFGAVSVEKFVKLGGYDLLFLPGIFEDADLCLRARRTGYQLLYEPRSLVFHMGQASFKRSFTNLRRETIASRNTFLFTWKNFSGLSFWISHILFLPARFLWAILRGRPQLILGFWDALIKRGKRS